MVTQTTQPEVYNCGHVAMWRLKKKESDWNQFCLQSERSLWADWISKNHSNWPRGSIVTDTIWWHSRYWILFWHHRHISPRTPHCSRLINYTKMFCLCWFKFILFWINHRHSGATEVMMSSSSPLASLFSSPRLWRSGCPSWSPCKQDEFHHLTECERQTDDDSRI